MQLAEVRVLPFVFLARMFLEEQTGEAVPCMVLETEYSGRSGQGRVAEKRRRYLESGRTPQDGHPVGTVAPHAGASNRGQAARR